ncbi:MAG: hypothetical protein M1840_005651 [Geoglossum simile]|nr:MAG: hypothetical protein M1840_005651 [Geoglossum simile]
MITTLAQLLLALAATASAQTFTSCNPLSQSCPPDPALGKSATIDFTKGSSDLFTTQGSPVFNANGAQFVVAKSGDSPQIISKFFMMFGKFEITLQAAPGAGIVSSAVLQSDDLDEIDWEWLGADNTQVQTNYFGKGQTGSYDRGAFHPDPGNQNGFHRYTIDWTASQIAWQIDGATVRTLTPDAAKGQYPQSPMQIKVGSWSGGDPANAPGTIQWARGPTDYAAGPYTMIVKSITATDYSTGTQYKYNDQSGNWQSIGSVGGTVNPGPSSPSSPDLQSQPAPPASPAASSKPTSSSPSMPFPFGNSASPTSTGTYQHPSIYPWIPSSGSPSTMTTLVVPGKGSSAPTLGFSPSSGRVIPPSAASVQRANLIYTLLALALCAGALLAS